MTTALETKLNQHAQRRNMHRLMADDIGDDLKSSIVEAIYFPLSSDILRAVRSAMTGATARTRSLLDGCADLIDAHTLQAIERLPDAPTVLCFFPSMKAGREYISSTLPVLEVRRSSAAQWYRLNAPVTERLDLFFCATPDLASGVAVDVCAGHPEIHGSDAALYDIVTWGAAVQVGEA